MFLVMQVVKNFLCLSLCLAVYSVIRSLTSSLKTIPGPVLAPFSGFYRVWLLSQGDGPQRYYRLHHKYGKVVRTGPNHVSFSNPSMITVIYDLKNRYLKVGSRGSAFKSRALKHVRQSHFYDVFKPLYLGTPMDTIFTTPNAAMMKVSKHALITNMTSCPQEYYQHISQSVDKFVECVRVSPSQIIDFSTWSFFWGFDMTYATAFGDPFGYMDKRTDFNGIVDSFTRVSRIAALMGQTPQLIPFILGNNTIMTFLRRFQSFPDPTQVVLEVSQLSRGW